MIEYTPSTEEVREQYWAVTGEASRGGKSLAEFNRWLVSERARIWDECDAAVVAHVEGNGTSAEGWPVNPYRKDGDVE